MRLVKFVFAFVLMGSVMFTASAMNSNENPSSDDKEYMLIFRMEMSEDYNPTPEEVQQMLEQWGGFIGKVAAQGKLVRTNELGFEASVVKADKAVQNGPFVSEKNVVGGYMIIKAASMEEAVKMAGDCPILLMGGTVEIRNVVPHEG
ncbi:YciI family protein [Ascidiimonas aurantiaca]|uniref:YciI family protein n=1 Tax=Ascidiimonas aurantiaca TaxID=1685432 RepID=UPI0030EC6078